MNTDDFRHYLLDLLPKASHKHVEAIVEYVAEDAYAVGAEVDGAHIAVDEQVIGEWTIRTDVVGNPVSIDFGQSSVQIHH